MIIRMYQIGLLQQLKVIHIDSNMIALIGILEFYTLLGWTIANQNLDLLEVDNLEPLSVNRITVEHMK